MNGELFHQGPALTVAVCVLFGALGLTFGHLVRLPSIVVLLALGVALGPDGFAWVDPQTLGEGLGAFVGMAVAVILFDGGLRLDLRQLRRRARAVRRLVLIGPWITMALAAVTASALLGWDWRLAMLYGSLVVVTGPTVIKPILERYEIADEVADTLEAEGVFVDAVGATIAALTIEIALSPSLLTVGEAFVAAIARVAAGAAIGALGGGLLVLIMNRSARIDRQHRGALSLGIAVGVYQVSEALFPEGGVVAALMAGLVTSNASRRPLDGVLDFKGQVSDLFVATLFILLAANVRIVDVAGLGWPGVAVIACTLLLVRPAMVAACTLGEPIELREKAFIAWLGPRGIVAAAIAALFATRLEAAQIPGGRPLQALVFGVIAVSVVVQGSSAGLVAHWLGLRTQTSPELRLWRGPQPVKRDELRRAIAARPDGDDPGVTPNRPGTSPS